MFQIILIVSSISNSTIFICSSVPRIKSRERERCVIIQTCEVRSLVSIDLKKWIVNTNKFRPKFLLFSREIVRIFFNLIQKMEGRNSKPLCECASRPNRDRHWNEVFSV